jgi:hydroxymethylglutaryl-CoA lyase
MADGLPTSVALREVGPRDGFRDEPETIATDDKVRLSDALARTGLHVGFLAGRSERERAEA